MERYDSLPKDTRIKLEYYFLERDNEKYYINVSKFLEYNNNEYEYKRE